MGFLNIFLKLIDLIIVHGDRVEALAGAIVGSLNNISSILKVEKYLELLMS